MHIRRCTTLALVAALALCPVHAYMTFLNPYSLVRYFYPSQPSTPAGGESAPQAAEPVVVAVETPQTVQMDILPEDESNDPVAPMAQELNAGTADNVVVTESGKDGPSIFQSFYFVAGGSQQPEALLPHAADTERLPDEPEQPTDPIEPTVETVQAAPKTFDLETAEPEPVITAVDISSQPVDDQVVPVQPQADAVNESYALAADISPDPTVKQAEDNTESPVGTVVSAPDSSVTSVVNVEATPCGLPNADSTPESSDSEAETIVLNTDVILAALKAPQSESSDEEPVSETVTTTIADSDSVSQPQINTDSVEASDTTEGSALESKYSAESLESGSAAESEVSDASKSAESLSQTSYTTQSESVLQPKPSHAPKTVTYAQVASSATPAKSDAAVQPAADKPTAPNPQQRDSPPKRQLNSINDPTLLPHSYTVQVFKQMPDSQAAAQQSRPAERGTNGQTPAFSPGARGGATTNYFAMAAASKSTGPQVTYAGAKPPAPKAAAKAVDAATRKTANPVPTVPAAVVAPVNAPEANMYVPSQVKRTNETPSGESSKSSRRRKNKNKNAKS